MITRLNHRFEQVGLLSQDHAIHWLTIANARAIGLLSATAIDPSAVGQPCAVLLQLAVEHHRLVEGKFADRFIDRINSASAVNRTTCRSVRVQSI